MRKLLIAPACLAALLLGFVMLLAYGLERLGYALGCAAEVAFECVAEVLR